jgi:hypothetical protein
MTIQSTNQSRLLSSAVIFGVLGLGGCGAVDPTVPESGPVEATEAALQPLCAQHQLTPTAAVGNVDRTTTPPRCCTGFTITVKNSSPVVCSGTGKWEVHKNHSLVRRGDVARRDFQRPTDFISVNLGIQKPFDVRVIMGGLDQTFPVR